MGFFGRLFGNEGEDTTVTDFQAETAATAATAAASAPVGQAASLADGTFRLVVEDVFTITGRGTVATGKIDAGSVSVGNRVTVTDAYGKALTSTVTGLEMFRKQVTTAGAGDNIGLLLEGVTRDDIARGSVVTSTLG